MTVTVAGLQELNTLNKITMYPNPATEKTTMEVISTENTAVVLSIVDNTGKVLLKSNNELVIGKNTIQLSVNKLNAGIYTVVLTTENQHTKTLKLAIKN